MVAFGICHHQVAQSLIGKMAKKLKCGNSLFSNSRFPPRLPGNKTTKDIPWKISVTSGVNLCDKASQASKRQPGRLLSHKNVVPNTKDDISKNISTVFVNAMKVNEVQNNFGNVKVSKR